MIPSLHYKHRVPSYRLASGNPLVSTFNSIKYDIFHLSFALAVTISMTRIRVDLTKRFDNGIIIPDYTKLVHEIQMY